MPVPVLVLGVGPGPGPGPVLADMSGRKAFVRLSSLRWMLSAFLLTPTLEEDKDRSLSLCSASVDDLAEPDTEAETGAETGWGLGFLAGAGGGAYLEGSFVSIDDMIELRNCSEITEVS